MIIDIVDVEHGACAIVHSPDNQRIAMVDCGHNSSSGWTPSWYLTQVLKRNRLDYLFITNPDEDHYSDLANLRAAVEIGLFYRNRQVSVDDLRAIKRLTGPLSRDAKHYLEMHRDYIHPRPDLLHFDQGMGGITCKVFSNGCPAFEDTNNLSLVVFLNFGSFQIVLPGDLEEAGWRALLQNPAFCQELQKTTILVASHHGRESGFCAPVFYYCSPQAIVISDKSLRHETQNTIHDYRNMVAGEGIYVSNKPDRRKVLTTRSDGSIRISVGQTHYTIGVSK